VDKLKKLVIELKVPDSVVFRGLVKHDELAYYYNAADVCVVPSYYESFGLVALESLACGTPVVATDVGDMKNIIRSGETGYVLSDNLPENIADAITRLLSMPRRDRESMLAIRASVSRFGWQDIAEKVLAEIRPVLDGQVTSVA
jgi:D-inositol-3-phosphate glycosyltransferase